MSLVKFRKRRPFGNLVTSDFFDMEDFFDNRFWNEGLLSDSFWNGRKGEPALNIKETDDNCYLIDLKGLIRFKISQEIKSSFQYREYEIDFKDYHQDLEEKEEKLQFSDLELIFKD